MSGFRERRGTTDRDEYHMDRLKALRVSPIFDIPYGYD